IVREGLIRVLPAKDLRAGDSIIVASKLPEMVTNPLLKGEMELLADPYVSTSPVNRGGLITRPVDIPISTINRQFDTFLKFFEGVLNHVYVDSSEFLTLHVGDEVSAKQVFNTLLSLGMTPSVVEESSDAVKIVIPSFKNLYSSRYALSDITSVKVVDVVEEDYEGYVYDFMVPGCNSFVGSYGVVYHNSDPYGWYIYSVFKIGSITLSYESERLATPDLRFLGVMPSDIFGNPSIKKSPYLSEAERRNFIIKAKERDIKRANELMNYKWFRTPRWESEIEIFMKKQSKLEIEALTSKGLKFLMDEYIPKKIDVKDWID
ncbi:MAG: hypothetical protein QXX69_03400, partial [Sulfolobales archaeon]